MTMPEPAPFTPAPAPVEPKKSRTGTIILIVVLLLLCCCLVAAGLGYYAWVNGDKWLGIGAFLGSLAAL